MKGGVSAISIVATCAYFDRGYPLNHSATCCTEWRRDVYRKRRKMNMSTTTCIEISEVSVAD
jgi:hypothetical protein